MLVEKNKEHRQRAAAISLIQKVPGIGPSKAISLVDDGCDSIAKLRAPGKYRDSLTRIMRIGADYFDHMDHAISRDKIESILEFFQTFLRVEGDISLQGSYRRGAKSISDPEFLIVSNSEFDTKKKPAKPSTLSFQVKKHGRNFMPYYQAYSTIEQRESTPLLNQVIEPLQNLGVLSEATQSGSLKWRGWLRIPGRNEDGSWENRTSRARGVAQRKGEYVYVSINLASNSWKGAAALALTGDHRFFFDLRSKATNLGMHLNEYGLWKWESTGSDIDDGHWILIEGSDEEAILKELGMEYVESTKRNFANLS